MISLKAMSLADVQEARERIGCEILRTPLVRLNVDDLPVEIYLKLENLQHVGSFKQRGAINVLKNASRDKLSQGISTASSGNFGLAMAWYANRMGIPANVVVQETSSDSKLKPLRKAGGTVIKLPFDEWFQLVSTGKFEKLPGHFIHPVYNRDIWAGHGTIALEILEDLPDVDVIITPYGGGGLFCGISSVIHELKPDTKLFVSEAETAAPVTAALAAGRPERIVKKPAPFHCVGGPSVLAPMWPLVSRFLEGAIVVTLAEVAEALRLMAEKNHVIAEGSGALPVAAAMTGKAGSGKVVCVVTGGNIDTDKFLKILAREIP